mmetsp:Transcript_82422/g.129666  ORF Transcript_82422/g.129666 Transcript_82422/m.129666 type:complete len:145 (-) Transcript_82422:64-498(-)
MMCCCNNAEGATEVVHAADAKSALDKEEHPPKAEPAVQDNPPPLKLADKEEPVVTRNPGEMTIQISKGGDDAVGLDVDWGDMQRLRITKVKEGLISKWNEAHPDQKVSVGDCIVQINGNRGNSKILLDQVKDSKNLEIVVVKGS